MNHVSCPFAPQTPLVSYLRHSPGEDQTIASQESAVRAWLAANDLVLVRLFKDEALSGTSTAGRDQFLQMFDLLMTGKISPKPAGLVLWSFSRFAREIGDAEYYKWSLRHKGYAVFSMTDRIPDGDLAPVFESFIHWKDAERSKEIGRDAQRGLQELAKQGYSTGGFPPVGYQKSAPVEIGRKRNGEVRVAYKWEKDPTSEPRVAVAWKMKLAGSNHWEIHRVCHLCASPRGYTDLFRNATYTGVRKCGNQRTENAHAAYVTKEEFDRVQSMRQPDSGRVSVGESSDHPARRKSNNTFLLSGILKCGYCGWSMVGNTVGKDKDPLYRCDWRHRAGRDACPQPQLAAHVPHELICDWISDEVVTYDRLLLLREQFEEGLSGASSTLRERQDYLRGEMDRVGKQIGYLLTTIERGGWGQEVQDRLDERKREKMQIELDLEGISERLSMGRMRISDEVMRFVAEHMREALKSRHPDYARRIIRMIVAKAELFKNELRLYYTPEPLMESLALSANPSKTGLWTVPPWEYFLNPSIAMGEEFVLIPCPPPPTGRASPMYRGEG